MNELGHRMVLEFLGLGDSSLGFDYLVSFEISLVYLGSVKILYWLFFIDLPKLCLESKGLVHLDIPNRI